MTVRPSDATAPAGAYRAIWRWHFYAGLIVAPFLIILAATGALYLFDREYEEWRHRDILAVAQGSAPLPLAAQEAAVARAFPGGEVRRVSLPRGPEQAGRWLVEQADGSAVEVYLDPYRGRVTGTVDPATEPMAIVRKIHGTLLAGDAGSYVVELTACWTLVMLVTGLYLWWPRKWKARGVFVPRLGSRGRRFWRDLHAIPAMFNALFVIFLVMTGLPWSVFWGQQYAQLGQIVPFVAPSPNFSAHLEHEAAPDGAVDHSMHDPERATLPWVIQHGHHHPAASGPARTGIAAVEAQLPLLGMDRHGPGARIFYPEGETGTFMVSYIPARAQGQRTLHIDPADGSLAANIGWEDYSPAAKATEWGVMTHMGRQYGWPNQLAGLLVCLGLIGSVTAGVILWWRRRPKGTLAAPQTHGGERMPRPLLALIAALAILFPLVGASLIVIFALDRLGRLMGRRKPSPA